MCASIREQRSSLLSPTLLQQPFHPPLHVHMGQQHKREKSVILYSSFKSPNRNSDSFHPVKKHCWCFEWEHVLLHNTLPFCVGTGEEGGPTICPKKATVKVLQGCMSKRLHSVSVMCPRAGEQELRAEWEGKGVLKRKPRMDGKTAYRQNNLPDSQSHTSKLQPSHIRHAHTGWHWWGCLV